MGTIEALSLAMGTAWTSGINLYATVAALGIANQAGMIQLPPGTSIGPLSTFAPRKCLAKKRPIAGSRMISAFHRPRMW